MKQKLFGHWFWATFVFTVVFGVWLQQHYMSPHTPIVIHLPAPPPDQPAQPAPPKQNPCTSMSKCN